MSPSAIEFLRHILDEVRYLKDESKDLTFAEFIENPTLIRAFTRSLEIIGEAAKKVPEVLKNKYPDIEWKNISGMRDKLVHEYFGIDYDLVWDVVKNELDELYSQIESIINREKE
ncbi:MAG: DUF86 domain-containing protein [Bacteroidetes bacterium]|nr:DUF86 domain-containing protein [Bacteroidota bacterium]